MAERERERGGGGCRWGCVIREVGVWRQRERERDRQTETGTERERDRDRETERERERQRKRQRQEEEVEKKGGLAEHDKIIDDTTDPSLRNEEA